MWWEEGCLCLPPFRYLFMFLMAAPTSRERDVQCIWARSFFFFFSPQPSSCHCHFICCFKTNGPNRLNHKQKAATAGVRGVTNEGVLLLELPWFTVWSTIRGSHEPAGVYFTFKNLWNSVTKRRAEEASARGESHIKLHVDSCNHLFRGFSHLLLFDSDIVVFVYLRTGSAQYLKQFLSWII